MTMYCQNCGEPRDKRVLVIAGMSTCPACLYWAEGGSSPQREAPAPIRRHHSQEERLPSELLPREAGR